MVYFALQGETWQRLTMLICKSTLLCFYEEQYGPGLLLSFVVVSLKFLYAFYKGVTCILGYI